MEASTRFAFSAIAIAFAATWARAGETWIAPNLGSSSPGRCCAGMAYDAAAHSTVMFGGFTNPNYLATPGFGGVVGPESRPAPIHPRGRVQEWHTTRPRGTSCCSEG